MGETVISVRAVGPKGKREVKGLVVDTGAAYTVIPKEMLEEIGAFKLPGKVDLELGDGRVVKADAYALRIEIGERGGPAISVFFEGAKGVVGVQTLESLGLRVNPITGELEETRPKGISHFYRS